MNKNIFVACDVSSQREIIELLSKIYEETFRGSVSDAIEHFSDKKIKGEFVICINRNEGLS